MPSGRWCGATASAHFAKTRTYGSTLRRKSKPHTTLWIIFKKSFRCRKLWSSILFSFFATLTISARYRMLLCVVFAITSLSVPPKQHSDTLTCNSDLQFIPRLHNEAGSTSQLVEHSSSKALVNLVQMYKLQWSSYQAHNNRAGLFRERLMCAWCVLDDCLSKQLDKCLSY